MTPDIFNKMMIKKISLSKSKLIKLAKRKGITENFGQKEVRQLEDLLNGNRFDPEYRQSLEAITQFDDWAMNFDQLNLKQYE